MWAQISEALQTAAITICVAALSTLSVVAVAYIDALKKKALKHVEQIEADAAQKELQAAVAQVEDLVTTVVMSIEQEEKQQIVAMMEDGKLDESELYALRGVAVDRVLCQLSQDTIDTLNKSFEDLNTYIADLVSRKVLELKKY